MPAFQMNGQKMSYAVLALGTAAASAWLYLHPTSSDLKDDFPADPLLTTFDPGLAGKRVQTDVFVYGAGLGGTAAALASAGDGADTVLVSEGKDVGGMAVSTGLSAFDDTFKIWEKYGLYLELQTYLRNKYPSSQAGKFGLGDAKVGTVASLPSDIRSFLEEKIRKQDRLRFFGDFALRSLIRNVNGMSGALLVQNGGVQSMLVTFRYAIDGTSTGIAIDKSQTPYSVGFDTKEATGENSALPEKIRDAFVSGYKFNGVKREGHGNLTQATGLPMALVDTGYTGTFFGIGDGQTPCLKTTEQKPFVKGGTVFAPATDTCDASIEFQPDFSDSYDIFLVRKGGDGMGVTLHGVLGEEGISSDVPKGSDEFLEYAGTFYLSNGKKYAMTLHMTGGDMAEGILLRNKNLRAPAASVTIRKKSQATLDTRKARSMRGDAYIQSEEEITAASVSGKQMAVSKAGRKTWKISGIRNAGNAMTVDFGKELSEATVTFIPTGPDEATEKILTESDVLRKPNDIQLLYFQGKQETWEWNLSPAREGTYGLFLDMPPGKWTGFELYDLEKKEELALTGGKSLVPLRSGAQPLWMGKLGARPYRILLSSAEKGVLARARIIVKRMDGDGQAFARTATEMIFTNNDAPRMYDVWVRAERTLDLTVVTSAAPSWKFHADYSKSGLGFAFVGKFFLDEGERMRLRANGGGISGAMAVPDFDTDVFEYAFGTAGANPSVRLPTGRWTARLSQDADAAGITLTGDASGTLDPVRPALGFVAKSRETQVKAGGATTGSVFFYEDIPSFTQDRILTFNSFLPLFATTAKKALTLFEYRNIVSPRNIYEKELGLPETSDVSALSEGMTVFLNSFTDYAPVPGKDLDSPALRAASLATAYDYYYWTKYMAPNVRDQLGCDPSVHCDAKRIAMATNVYGTADGFPESVYVREGRRIESMAPVTEKDMAASYLDCTKDACNERVCDSAEWTITRCLAKRQEPSILAGALAAVHYQIDFHRFLPIEYDAAVNQFLREMKSLFPDASLDQTVFRRYARSLPTEITAGSLIPKNGGNVFPGSLNFGSTQISNAALRVHPVEMQIGASAGHLVAFAVKKGISPRALYADAKALRELQRSLVRKGTNLYPINIVTNADVMKGIQYLVLDGILKPDVEMKQSSVSYVVPNGDWDDGDLPIMKEIFPSSDKRILTYRDMLVAILGTDHTDAELVKLGKEKGALPAEGTESMLENPIRKYDLYMLYGYFQDNE